MITERPIDVEKVLWSVGGPSSGGTVLFVGTIRRQSGKKIVKTLEYEVYKDMANKRMMEIEKEVRSRWPVKKMAMVHRYGKLKVGEASVAVAVSCEHRAEAFEACRYAIDAIKETVPLWKKEKFSGGEEDWVEGVPIGP